MAMASMQSSGSDYRPELDEAERASRDEIAALQTEAPGLVAQARLRQRPALHARRSTRPACIPTTSRRSPTSAQIPVHRESRPARQLSLRHVRGAARKARAHPRVHRAPPASRPSSATPQDDIDIWSDVMARSIRAAGGRPGDEDAQRLRLRPVHRRARRALRRRSASAARWSRVAAA